MKNIKCILVGDYYEGKKQLLENYTSTIPNIYCPYYISRAIVEGQQITLQLINTSTDHFSKLRPLLYYQTDVFIITFSLVYPTTLENVENQWVPEILEHCPRTPYILVGLRSSLRDEFHLHTDEYKSYGWSPVSTEKGEEMKRKICAAYYVECDALNKLNLNEVFESASKCVIHPQQNYENLFDRNQRLKQEELDRIRAEKEAEKARKKAEKLRIKEEKRAKKAQLKEEKEAEKLRKQVQKQDEKNKKKIEKKDIKPIDETKKDKRKLHISFHCSFNISFD